MFTPFPTHHVPLSGQRVTSDAVAHSSKTCLHVKEYRALCATAINIGERIAGELVLLWLRLQYNLIIV